MHLRKRIKQRWGVLRAAVILQGKKTSKVSATSTRSFPYPSEFAKPLYPTAFEKPNFPTKFEKPHFPTEFAKPYFPTEFTGPNQIQTQTQTTSPETLSRWDRAIHQLVLQADTIKRPVSWTNEDSTEPKLENAPELKTEETPEPSFARNRWIKVSHLVVDENKRKHGSAAPPPEYCPSLPAPVGPFPPPAFTYNSPARRVKTISGHEDGSLQGNKPTPIHSRWNSLIQQVANHPQGPGSASEVVRFPNPLPRTLSTSEVASMPVSNIYPSLPVPSPLPTFSFNASDDEKDLWTNKFKTA